MCSYSPLACSTSLPLAAGKAMLSFSAAQPSSMRRLEIFTAGVADASVSSTTDLELSTSTTFTVNTLSFTSFFMQEIPSEVHVPNGGFTPKKSHSMERFWGQSNSQQCVHSYNNCKDILQYLLHFVDMPWQLRILEIMPSSFPMLQCEILQVWWLYSTTHFPPSSLKLSYLPGYILWLELAIPLSLEL